MKTQEVNSNVFKNKTLEKFSETNALLVVRVFFLLSISIFIYGYFSVKGDFLLKAGFFLAGLISFSFIEYFFHRFVYHSGHNYKDGKSWQYKIHGIHHSFPKDKHRIAMPLALALFLALLFYFLFSYFMGEYSLLFFPGFILGYALYLFVHYLIHTRKPPNNFFGYLWKHHHLHHHKYENKAFGVSSPLWDFLLGTMPPKV